MNLPYFRYFVGDFSRLTAGMTVEEEGAYTRCWRLSWDQNQPGTLLSDDTELARLLSITTKRWAALKPYALKGWTNDGQRLVNEWLHRESKDSMDKVTQLSAAGRKAVTEREAKKQRLNNRSSIDHRSIISSSSSSSEPEIKTRVDSPNWGDLNEPVLANTQKREADSEQKKNPSLNGFPWPWPEGVEHSVTNWFTHIFYPAYPLKQKKHRALEVFQLLQPSVPYLTEIMAFLEREKVYWRETGQTPPLPDNFLKRRDWEHSRPSPPAVKANGLIVSDALEPELHEVQAGNDTSLNKSGNYPCA